MLILVVFFEFDLLHRPKILVNYLKEVEHLICGERDVQARERKLHAAKTGTEQEGICKSATKGTL